MRWLPLLWAGLWRKRARTIFTLLSITIAFLLVGLMSGVDASFNHLLDQARLDRLIVTDRFGGSMPMAYMDQIGRLPGVTHVAKYAGLPGFYRDQKTGGLGVAMVDEHMLAVEPETPITPDQYAQLRRTRTGIIVNRMLADRFGWKAGDRIAIQSAVPNNGSKTWTFDIVAVVPPTANNPGQGLAVGNLTYMDEGRGDDNKGRVNWIMLLISDARQASQTANAIEALFENSSIPVNAMPEQLAMANGLQGFINMTFVTYGVSAAALFMILFLTTNVMVQSVRERIPEFAVMKTVGMTDRAVFALVLAEALVPYLIGAALGLALSEIPPDLFGIRGLGAFTPLITPGVLISGLALAVITAILGGLPAAWRVKRLPVAEALVVR